MSASEAERKPDEEGKASAVGGELLFCGGTSWEMMGRQRGSASGNLMSPTRLRPLVGVDIRFVASGCVSCHCVAVDTQGRCYTWGRNEKGQLGHGDTLQRNLPTVVSDLSKYKIVRASAGRSHTVVVIDDGKSFAFGWNKHGQLGIGSVKNEIEPSPVLCAVSETTNAVCGADFTVWLSSLEGSSILTAGLPQYGQLGHGTDNEYNAKDSSVKLVYQPQPRPKAVAALSTKSIAKAACGTNHTVAVDVNGYVYTWGFGGYGRLGHREQKDEWAPRLVEVFQKQNVLPPNAIVSAGAANSACTAGGGQLYMWGKIKNTGDDWMYPKPVMDLSGWNIRCMDSGNMHHFVGADESCISWGAAQSGELGYGPLGQKSSANPKKVEILDGMRVMSVACGMSLSMIVVDKSNMGHRLDQLDIYDGDTPVEAMADDKSNATTNNFKKKANVNSSTNSKKRKEEDSSDSEGAEREGGESEDAYSDDEEMKGKRGSKPSGRGRGSGSRGRGRGRPKSTDTKSSGRARAGPKSYSKASGRGTGKTGKKAKR